MDNIVRKGYRPLLFAILLIGLFSACKEDQGTVAPSPIKNVKIPVFQVDSAYSHIEKQMSFGPRIPGSQSHTDCKDWMASKLKEYGADVIEQNFTENSSFKSGLKATNVIGQFNPEFKKRIILAAHWDTRYAADADPDPANHTKPVPGADDGGSGVGVILEIARLLSENPIEMGVDVIFFDLEDQGTNDERDSWGLGAQYWSRNLHKPGYRAKYGVLLDMVGTKNARFGKEAYSMRYAKNPTNKIWQLAQNMGYSDLFVNDNIGGVTDDHYFVNTIAGIPMLDIINKPIGSETGFGPHWHTLQDDMDIIDKRTLRVVGQVVTTALYREYAGTL